MESDKIVLDTNCLIAILSRKGRYFSVWQGLHEGKFILCVSNEILHEYEEILSAKTNAVIASNVVQVMLNSPFVEFVDTYFHFHLIEQDKDDNKFVDCAIAANAQYIVSEDSHFKVLEQIPFPKVNVLRLASFARMLMGCNWTDNANLLNEPLAEYNTGK